MCSRHTAERCWPFLLFLGIQMPDCGSAPSFPSALNVLMLLWAHRCWKQNSEEMQWNVSSDALGWMALLLILCLSSYMPPPSSPCFMRCITLQTSFLWAVKGGCWNNHLGHGGVLSSWKCAWHYVSCLTQCLLYIWPACQGRGVI